MKFKYLIFLMCAATFVSAEDEKKKNRFEDFIQGKNQMPRFGEDDGYVPKFRNLTLTSAEVNETLYYVLKYQRTRTRPQNQSPSYVLKYRYQRTRIRPKNQRPKRNVVNNLELSHDTYGARVAAKMSANFAAETAGRAANAAQAGAIASSRVGRISRKLARIMMKARDARRILDKREEQLMEKQPSSIYRFLHKTRRCVNSVYDYFFKWPA